MALILDHFYSAALTECNSLTAIVPVENNEKSSYPVLWLLPPAGYDHTAWQRHTAVEDLADELGIIIVMPDLKLRSMDLLISRCLQKSFRKWLLTISQLTWASR